MKDNEVIAGHLSPCVRIFIQSVLNGELATSGGDAGDTEKSRKIKKGSGKAKPSETKSPR